MPVSLADDRGREARRSGAIDDNRTRFQRDRDRILYSSAFRRLAEVTQVVGADEGYAFHNRLTHSLEVGQFARRLAEKLCAEQRELAQKSNLSPDVAEAAGLAHDIGHPPFGHVAEAELDRLVSEGDEKVADGFEGNAQSFRVITKLAIHLQKEVKMFKELAWHYVIRNPALATQQYGLRKIVENLFNVFWDACQKKDFSRFPFSIRDYIRRSHAEGDGGSVVRCIADLISGLTERQAINLHRRFTGTSLGSALDPIIL
jgi:dGTP triphosphohydrolase